MKILLSALALALGVVGSTSGATHSLRTTTTTPTDEAPEGMGAALLLRQNQTCYELVDGVPVSYNETACSDAFLEFCGTWNGCAEDERNAVLVGFEYCLKWTVWTNDEKYCEWQWMCC